MKQQKILLLLVGIGLIMVAGCGGGEAGDLVPVTGTLMLDGEPLDNATVTMQVEGAPRVFTGQTDETGKFEIFKGCRPGKAKVMVAATQAQDTDPMEVGAKGTVNANPSAGQDYGASVASQSGGERADEQRAEGNETLGEEVVEAESLIPAKYNQFRTSGLEVEVKMEGENNFTIELTSEG